MKCAGNLNKSLSFIELFSPDKLLHLHLPGQELVLELVDGADAGHGLYPRPRAPEIIIILIIIKIIIIKRAPGMRGRVNTEGSIRLRDPAVVAALIKLQPTSHESIIKRLQPRSLWDCLSDKVGVGIMF